MYGWGWQDGGTPTPSQTPRVAAWPSQAPSHSASGGSGYKGNQGGNKGPGGASRGGAAAVKREPSDGASSTGEVRFEDAESAANALQQLDGVPMNGTPLNLALDPASKDKTKLLITGLPDSVQWQDVKDHFKRCPNVAFVNIRGGRGPTLIGEVRYDTAVMAQQALQMLNGSEMDGGAKLSISMDSASKDGTKLIITGIPPGSGWQELKDHFSQAGPVAYAGIVNKAGTGPVTGEVRYDNPEHAKMAMSMLNGSTLRGAQISLLPAQGSVDGSKLIVNGMSPGTEWQELKDHFAQIGQVAFAQVSGGSKGGGKGCVGAVSPYGISFGGMGGGMGKGCGMMPVMMMVPMGPDGQPVMGKGGKWGWDMPIYPAYGKAMR